MMLAETNIPGFSGTSPSDRSLSSLVVEATLSLSCGQSATLPDVRGRTAGCRLGHARLEVADKHSPASCRAALSNGIADQAHKYSSERLSEPCQTRPVRPVVVCHTWHASETEDEILGESGDAPRARASGRRKHPGTKLARRAEHSWSLALSSSSLSSSSSSSSSTSPCSTHLQGVVARCWEMRQSSVLALPAGGFIGFQGRCCGEKRLQGVVLYFYGFHFTCGSALGSPVLAMGRAFAGNRSRRNPRNTEHPTPLTAKPIKRDFSGRDDA